MPFIRTGYRQHLYTTEQLHWISRGIMQALQEHFYVPEKGIDKFYF